MLTCNVFPAFCSHAHADVLESEKFETLPVLSSAGGPWQHWITPSAIDDHLSSASRQPKLSELPAYHLIRFEEFGAGGGMGGCGSGPPGAAGQILGGISAAFERHQLLMSTAPQPASVRAAL